MLPKISKVSSLYNRSSCQALSNIFEMSKKLPLTSSDWLWSKLVHTLLIIDRSSFGQESIEQKPDWLGVSNLFSWRKLKNWLVSLSNILPHVKLVKVKLVDNL